MATPSPVPCARTVVSYMTKPSRKTLTLADYLLRFRSCVNNVNVHDALLTGASPEIVSAVVSAVHGIVDAKGSVAEMNASSSSRCCRPRWLVSHYRGITLSADRTRRSRTTGLSWWPHCASRIWSDSAAAPCQTVAAPPPEDAGH
eukprot:830570-Prorocentrum_minimum.AAC.1